MYKPYENGSSINIQGLQIHLPAFGQGVHCVTGETGPADIIKRSTKKSEQYWEAPFTDDEIRDLEKRKLKELARQEIDSTYFDPELSAIEEREWKRRTYGVWFYNNGEPVYLTGLNYFFLAYWPLDTGLPDFRMIDVEYFYFWQYCVFDPKCYGMIEVRKRRDGKSYRAGCMLYECISRTRKALGGIQSKTESDAEELFQKAIVPQFRALPYFFRPVFDTQAGSSMKGKLRFFESSKKGKQALLSLKGEELQSLIDYRDSKPKAYDGSKTKRLILDESGKIQHDVIKRHLIVKHCCRDNRGNIIGKMLVTSTCEEIGVEYRFDELWRWSDQNTREENGATKSGLYKFFMPANRAGAYDVYGYCDEDATLKNILLDRKALQDYPDDLIEAIRKEPLTETEAFKVSANDCVYNSMKIDEQLDFVSWNKNLTTRGNFEWKDGVQYSEVYWEPNPKGRWEVTHLLSKEEANNVISRGNTYIPGNRVSFCAGCDPYDFDKTKDGRRSMGSIYLKWKASIFHQDNPANDSLIVRYANRPEMADMFYDDVIKTVWYYGAEILVERNRYGLVKFMKDNGFNNFLIYLPGEKEPGVYASSESNQELTRVTNDYINKKCNKVMFPELLKQWLSFDPSETEKFDEAMAAGYALLADRHHKVREVTTTKEVTQYFRKHKIA